MEVKILIIDDDVEFLEELSAALGTIGYSIAYISGPSEALANAGQLYPDVIYSTVKCPVRTVFKITGELCFVRNFLISRLSQ